MNSKTTMGLVIALVIAVGGVWWATSSESKPDKTRAPSEPRPLFDPGFGDLTRFEMTIGDKPSFVFEKADDKWRMLSPMAGLAEQGFVRSDSDRIKNLKYLKAFSKDDPDRPEASITLLDKPLRIIKLTDADGKTAVVRIGAMRALSSKTYVATEGDDRVYLVDLDLHRSLKKTLSQYRGKRVIEFTANDAARIEVTGQRNYTLVKTDKKWMLESPIKARASQAKASGLAVAVSNLRAQEYVDDNPKNLRIYGLDEPATVIAVTTEKKTPKPLPEGAEGPVAPEFDVETHTYRVAFGATTDDTIFARLLDEDSPAVFQVAASILKQASPELKDLRDDRVTEIAVAAATHFTLTHGGQTAELEKVDGTWRILDPAAPDQPDADAEFAAVDDILKALRGLKATGYEDEALPAFGLDQPRVRIEVTVEGRIEPLVLTVGALTPSKTGVYIKNERDGLIYVVSAGSVDPLRATPHAFRSRDLLRFPIAKASALELTRGDETIQLQKVSEAWRFSSPISDSAGSAAVAAVLADLSNLRGRRVVGTGGEAAAFGLDAPAVRVAVTVDAPPPPATTQPADSQPAALPPTVHRLRVHRHTDDKVYAMLEGGGTICEIDGKVHDDLTAELLDTKITTIDPSQVTALSYGGPEPFEFTKSGTGWALEGESSFQADTTKITNVLNALRDLAAERFAKYNGASPAEFGLDAPAAVVGVRMEDGATTTVSVSATGPSPTQRYASTAATPDRVFVVKKADADKLTLSLPDFHRGG